MPCDEIKYSLVQNKLAQLRIHDLPSADFRLISNEIASILMMWTSA